MMTPMPHPIPVDDRHYPSTRRASFNIKRHLQCHPGIPCCEIADRAAPKIGKNNPSAFNEKCFIVKPIAYTLPGSTATAINTKYINSGSHLISRFAWKGQIHTNNHHF